MLKGARYVTERAFAAANINKKTNVIIVPALYPVRRRIVYEAQEYYDFPSYDLHRATTEWWCTDQMC